MIRVGLMVRIGMMGLRMGVWQRYSGRHAHCGSDGGGGRPPGVLRRPREGGRGRARGRVWAWAGTVLAAGVHKAENIFHKDKEILTRGRGNTLG